VPDYDKEAFSEEYFTLWVLLAQTKDAILRARERDYARYGISNERRAILYVIQSKGGHAAPVDIARSLFRELHSITEMLRRMETDGLISRHKGSGRSKVEVRLTDKAQDVLAQSLHNETDKRIFSVLPKEDRERLASFLWKIRSTVLQDLGIPEWWVNYPLSPNGAGGVGGAGAGSAA
jgi:DNA-binding MarR family transcriptional regulator